MLTPQHLDQINQVVVKAGHKLLGYDGQSLKGRLVILSYWKQMCIIPQISSIYFGMRYEKSSTLTAAEFGTQGITEWRQSRYVLRKINTNCLLGHADSNGPIQKKKSARLKKNSKLFRLTSNMLIWFDFILNAPGLISIF